MRAPVVHLALLAALGLACGSGPLGSMGALDGGSVDGGPGDGGSIDGGSCPVGPPTGIGVVVTDRGLVRGEPLPDGGFAFRGIPYAAPPMGERRFGPPAEVDCWSGVRDATGFGPACPQLDAAGNPQGEEDCLSLNVWTPSLTPPSERPVMVFVHGGGNNQGASSASAGAVAIYEGRHLAARGTVVVTLNYRLGALGYLAHPRLDAEQPTGTSGNWGLLDQLAALRWVQRNIGTFGGDPGRVLLFGESAGGANTCALLASPLSAGLFQRALIESGGCSASSRAAAVDAAQRLLVGAGCTGLSDPIECLRAKTPAEVLRALPAQVTGLGPTDFAPSVDGYVLRGAPLDEIRAGRHQRVPVVLGSNRDETYRMLPPPTQIATDGQLQAAARLFLAQFGLPRAIEDGILAVYPASDYPNPHAALVALTTDIRWTCPGRVIVRALSAHGPTWRYYFTHTLDPARAPAAAAAGAYHGLELFYVFGILNVAGYLPTQTDLDVSAAIQAYWSRFAATGNPNGDASPVWPAHGIARDPYLELGAAVRAGEGVRGAQCDALETALAR